MSNSPNESVRFVSCRCRHCDGGIEFDAADFDKDETRNVDCPHCGLETIIFVPQKMVPPVLVKVDENLPQIAKSRPVGNPLSTPITKPNGLEEDEVLIRQCLEVIRAEQKASVSLLQRSLNLGYGLAARIMDKLEDRGMVGPSNGAEPRQILADLDAYLNSEKFSILVSTADAKWQYDLGATHYRQKQYNEAYKCFLIAAEKGLHRKSGGLAAC